MHRGSWVGLEGGVEVQLISYFAVEKLGAVLFMVVGMTAFGVSLWLHRSRQAWRGMTVPLVLIGCVQLGVGASVYLRTDGQVAQLRTQLQQAPEAYQAEEAKRMQAVVENFRLYQVIEVTLLIMGLALLISLKEFPWWRAIGAGLALQGTVMLVLDVLAEIRAVAYLKAIGAFTGV